MNVGGEICFSTSSQVIDQAKLHFSLTDSNLSVMKRSDPG
jgi:hypothetical protein